MTYTDMTPHIVQEDGVFYINGKPIIGVSTTSENKSSSEVTNQFKTVFNLNEKNIKNTNNMKRNNNEMGFN